MIKILIQYHDNYLNKIKCPKIYFCKRVVYVSYTPHYVVSYTLKTINKAHIKTLKIVFDTVIILIYFTLAVLQFNLKVCCVMFVDLHDVSYIFV